ncbi:MAG: MerR family transcriptional regulator [Pseudomonadota bacterium]|nr:MerR family transcriptional regulator [Pseudomonadota bacterium]
MDIQQHPQDKALDKRVLTHLLDDESLLQSLQNIPDKMAFKIGEVAVLAMLKQHVLRYWEQEFELLAPKKSNHNQRMYTRKDVETVLLIKKLLYKDKFSISGAREVLRRSRQEMRKDKGLKEVIKGYTRVHTKAKVLLSEIRHARARLGL